MLLGGILLFKPNPLIENEIHSFTKLNYQSLEAQRGQTWIAVFLQASQTQILCHGSRAASLYGKVLLELHIVHQFLETSLEANFEVELHEILTVNQVSDVGLTANLTRQINLKKGTSIYIKEGERTSNNKKTKITTYIEEGLCYPILVVTTVT